MSSEVAIDDDPFIEPYDIGNDYLRIQHKHSLEKLHQQLYDIQTERESLRLRLIAAEGDYDSQIKELQSEIAKLRTDFLDQKRAYRKANNENQEIIADLSEKNLVLQECVNENTTSSRRLSIHVKELQEQLLCSRACIKIHVNHIESLQEEITQLKHDKISLEKQLQTIMDERDLILNSLSDAQMTTDLLHTENENQQAVLSHQDCELVKLQETASVLKEQLNFLGKGGSSTLGARSFDDIVDNERFTSLKISQPHHSLLGELSCILPENESSCLHKQTPFDMSRSYLNDDDGIEMDDESFLAISGALRTPNSEPFVHTSSYMLSIDSYKDTCMSQMDEQFNLVSMDGFRSEVNEIYNQLRQMCLDFSARSTVFIDRMKDQNSSSSRPGDCTPDQLALLEWDFRLASLRNVLTDLRFLLQELISSTVIENTSSSHMN